MISKKQLLNLGKLNYPANIISDYSNITNLLRNEGGLPKKLNNKVSCIYSNINIESKKKDVIYDFFNIEHIIPKSIFKDFKKIHNVIYHDLHITYPSLLVINSLRSNYSYGETGNHYNVLIKYNKNCNCNYHKYPECSKEKNQDCITILNKDENIYQYLKKMFNNHSKICVKKCQTTYLNLRILNVIESKTELNKLSQNVIDNLFKLNLNLICTNKQKGYKINNCIVEPPKKSKGIIARVIFYFYITYYLPTPSNQTKKFKLFINHKQGGIDMLLKWHLQNPVLPNSMEMKRNKEIYKIQHNYNIFVGYGSKISPPSLAKLIFSNNKNVIMNHQLFNYIDSINQEYDYNKKTKKKITKLRQTKKKY